MTENYLNEIRQLENLNSAIIGSIILEREKNCVTVRLLTDKVFSSEEKEQADRITRNYIPHYFNCNLIISKLTPDEEMIKRKIIQAINENYKTLSVTLQSGDICVKKVQNGFTFTISVMSTLSADGVCNTVTAYLKKSFCGEFSGRIMSSARRVDELEVEEEHENTEYEIPIRMFDIRGFKILEGTEKQTQAVYLSDLNFESEKVIVCGVIEDIQERNYTNKKNQEKTYFSFTINDNTATMRLTYFTRQKSIDRIRSLKVGDSIVCTGKSEIYKGFLRFTANYIDYGSTPENFVSEKRASKPVPEYYSIIKPQPFTDISQADMFSDNSVPECLMGKTFVVFDLETTGLNSSPSSGNMDRIIEIGAYKVIDGVICECFSTFINPMRKLSEEIINLTGITEEMVLSAPTYEKVMPDFFKFCSGSILVGHNVANFDFRFVDYYCASLGYMLERKIIDTLQFSHEVLTLSNNKLNTVADHFGITFNHHRAIDDAYVTAKIFIELAKIKKSLPKLQ